MALADTLISVHVSTEETPTLQNNTSIYTHRCVLKAFVDEHFAKSQIILNSFC